MKHGLANVELDFSLEIGHIGSLHFSCYYLQYVPVSKPLDHARFEVLEAITLYCTWSDNRQFQGKLVWENSRQIYTTSQAKLDNERPDR
jgi:hypothetical protein